MANDGSPRAARGGTGRRCCGGTLTRVDLLIFLLAAALCSASYCLGIWHNSRGAADSSGLLGPSAAGATYCGDDADGPPLDFETHHAAEDAGLSVSSTAAKTTSTRRALLLGAAGGSTARRGVAWAAAAASGSRTPSRRSTPCVQPGPRRAPLRTSDGRSHHGVFPVLNPNAV